MIAIIDYGAGNIRSIEKALEYSGAQVQVTGDPAVVAMAHAIVLPGVGSGGAAMARMTERGLDEAIRQATRQGKPFLGICLGMQFWQIITKRERSMAWVFFVERCGVFLTGRRFRIWAGIR